MSWTPYSARTQADALRLQLGSPSTGGRRRSIACSTSGWRAAKAADLQARLGVSVDWQRYSWVELEALRRTLLSFENGGQRNQPLPPPSSDALVQPQFKPAPARGEPKARLSDPDAIIRPTFARRPNRDAGAATPMPSSGRRLQRGRRPRLGPSTPTA